MRLEETVAAVESLFLKLDGEISRFQTSSGLHCKYGCGACCFKPDIEATVLEFLPFAFHLYQTKALESWHKRIQSNDSTICAILAPTQSGAGLCSSYKHRGLICRLFGYSARINKYEAKELITCAIIKTEQKQAFEKAEKGLQENLHVPIMTRYYMQLLAINPELGRDRYAINTALMKAVEQVMHLTAYRDAD